MQKGNIGVTTENIFPIIKKFLYSDHEIFLRELVSNAVDATQKLNTLASIGEFKGELGDLTIHVELGKDTITISDHGIGLTAEEIEKYINQIDSASAQENLKKNIAVVQLDRPVEDTDLRTAVARAGFTVAGIEQMEA